MTNRKIFVILAISILIIPGSFMAVGAGDIQNKEVLKTDNKNIIKEKFIERFVRLLDNVPFLDNGFISRVLNINKIITPGLDISNFDDCIVNVPTETYIMSHFTDLRPCCDYRITIQGIPSGFDVTSTDNYCGWCIDYGTIPPITTNYPVKLYSTYCPPTKFELDPGLWNKVNYLLNNYNCPTYNYVDIRDAIYYFVNYGPWPKLEWGDLSLDSQTMITDAEANGGFFEPECGQIVAVICDNNPGDEDPYTDHTYQYFVIEVPVPCDDGGCTLTLGYWKTHANPNKKQYDETWNAIGGPGELFFDTGKSYIEILKSNPGGKSGSSGNGYIILAHQYIAAYLNGIYNNDGSIPPVYPTTPGIGQIMSDAHDLLDFYDSILDIPKDDPNRAIAIGYASTLDDFNNGLIPGWLHC